MATYEVYAIRYATRDAQRCELFIGSDPHEGQAQMDYYVWVIVGNGRLVLVDTGFSEEMARRRGRRYLRSPLVALRRFGFGPDDVTDVVVTHLHYDHAGNVRHFRNAIFHLQEAELFYAVGRSMKYAYLRHPFELEDVLDVIRAQYAGRVRLYRGQQELYPGITTYPAPGHSPGIQFVRVATRRGAIVLASDVAHFYESFTAYKPFTVSANLVEMMESFDLLRDVAACDDLIIPGHDPEVMRRYRKPPGFSDDLIVRLDEQPIGGWNVDGDGKPGRAE